MKYNDVIDHLQNLTLSKINTTEIAKIINVPVRTLYTRSYRNSEMSAGELKKIEEHYGINLFTNENVTNNIQTVELDYYPDLDYSCGNGLIPFGYTKEKKKVPVSLINGYSEHKRYVVVNAKSDSMMPEIKPNDLLIIRVIDAEPIIDNHIYVFCHDEHLYCKYLSYNIGQVIVRSANKDYPTRYIEGENLESFRLHGEVCGHFRSYVN